MAGEDEEISVVIEDGILGDDGGDVDQNAGKGTDKVVRVDTDDPIESLKGQLEEMKSIVSTTQQTATSAVSAAHQLGGRLQQTEKKLADAESALGDNRLTTINSGISAAEQELAAAKRDLQEAFDAGKGDKVADAQERVATAVADLRELRASKADIATRQAVDRTERREPVQQPSHADPVEDFIQKNIKPGPSQNWLRNHRDFVSDPVKNKKLIAAHAKADAEGIALESPQYFDFIEKDLGLKAAPQSPPPPPPAGGQRRPVAPTAPVTTGAGGTSGGGKVQVTLTASEARAAEDGTVVWNVPDPTGKNRWKVGDPVGRTEFARRKLAMQKEGRYQGYLVDQ